jgi:hypothetical protein
MAVTTAAVVGIASAGVTAGMSFSQASKQRKAMNQAEKDADEAMQEARKKLDVNVYDKLAINKEPFELQREAMLSQGAQAIQAGVESERGAEATAGRIQLAMNEGQAGIRTEMGQDLQQLEMLSAQEEGRLRDIGVQLDLEEVAGAQLAAANAQELGAAALAQGMEGVTSLGSQLAEKAPLFEKNRAAEQSAIGGLTLSGNKLAEFEKSGKMPSVFEGGNIDLSKVGQMNPQQYRQFRKELSPSQRQILFGTEQFQTLYNQFAPVTSLSR